MKSFLEHLMCNIFKKSSETPDKDKGCREGDFGRKK